MRKSASDFSTVRENTNKTNKLHLATCYLNPSQLQFLFSFFVKCWSYDWTPQLAGVGVLGGGGGGRDGGKETAMREEGHTRCKCLLTLQGKSSRSRVPPELATDLPTVQRLLQGADEGSEP